MASTHIRKETLVKVLNTLYEKRRDIFEEIQYFAAGNSNEHLTRWYGHNTGIKRAIRDVLVAFDLTDTELYKLNEETFELQFLTNWEEKRDQDNAVIPPSSPELLITSAEKDLNSTT